MVPNLSGHGKYNLISVWFNKISKTFLSVCCIFLLQVFLPIYNSWLHIFYSHIIHIQVDHFCSVYSLNKLIDFCFPKFEKKNIEKNCVPKKPRFSKYCNWFPNELICLQNYFGNGSSLLIWKIHEESCTLQFSWYICLFNPPVNPYNCITLKLYTYIIYIQFALQM